MAISVDPFTDIIFVPKADLTLVQASPEVRELDVNSFRLWLRDWEDEEANIYRPKTHTHSTEIALAGLTYARIIEILDPYTVEFEDGQYTINCVGANHNISDVKVANQVSLIVNNAAGLINNAQIEYASYNGGITVDVNSPYDGTLFPVGTPQAPVNNLSDALLIAQNRGFTTFYVTGDLTITEALDLESFVFVGESMTKSEIDIDSSANCTRCEFYDCHVIGTLDGENMLKNCRLTDLTYVNGVIEQCLLGPGTIILGGSTTAHFLDCWSGVPGTSTPIIDMGGSGQELALRNYNGGIELRNKNGTDPVSIDLNSGQVVLDSTITAGTVVIRGIGKLTDNSVGANIMSDDLLNHDNLSIAVWDEQVADHQNTGTTGRSLGVQQYAGIVHVDPTSGNTGTVFPLGTERVPVNNLTDARSIGEANGLYTLNLHGSVTFDIDFNNWTIQAANPDNATANLNNRDFEDCSFRSLRVSGSYTGHCNFANCTIDNGLSNVSANFENCLLAGTFTIAGGIEGDRCTSASGVIFDLGGTASLSMANFSGVLTITNLSNVAAFIGITGNYLLTLDSSLTNGQALIAGIGIINDNSNGLSVTQRTIPDTVWDVDTSNFTTDGTVGKELVTRLDRSLGLMQENFRMDNQTYQDYNGGKLLTSARIRTYSDDSLTQLLATYQVTATWANGECTSYQVAKI